MATQTEEVQGHWDKGAGGSEEERLIKAGPNPDGWKLPIDVFLERKTTDEEIRGLHKRYSRSTNSSATNNLIRYYRKKNTLIDSLEEADNIHGYSLLQKDKEEDCSKKNKGKLQLVKLSLATNVILLIIKSTMAVLSGSLAIITSALDSLLDITSGTILFLTNRAMSRPNKYKYPVGKTRMEPLGIIVFSSMMGTVGFTVLVEAVQQFVGEEHIHHLEELNLIIAFMGFTIIVKFVLYIMCRHSKEHAVVVLANDHLNDVFTNTVGLVGAILGDRVAFWIDPLAAIFLAAYISKVWGTTAYEYIISMVGLSADPSYLQKLTFLSCNHHPSIVQVDTVRAYTFGKNLLAEVDLVLPGDMALRDAHDIGESLQNKIESMPEIERAFVHLDYDSNHKPEH